MLRFMVVVIALLFSPLIVMSQDNQVERLQVFYSALKDAEGSFIQKNRIRELGKTIAYKGYFYLKHDKMHLEYRGDNPHRIYISEATLIVYNEKNKTAYKMSFDERQYGQTPVALLRGLADIKKDFQIKKEGEDRFILKPAKGIPNVERFELRLSKDEGFPVESLVMVDSAGNSTEITFKNVKFNQGVSERVFKFIPPQGTTIVEN